MGLFKRDRKANIDPALLAQIRGYRMAHCSKQEAFDELREQYRSEVSDAKIWEAINYIYDDD